MDQQEVPSSDLPESLAPNLSGAEVPSDDLPQQSGTEVPPEDLPHTSTGQQALTALEGVGRGISAGLTDPLAAGMRKGATALGVPQEYLHYIAPEQKEIEARKQENPIEAGASEIAGNIGLMTALPQIGSKAINGMIQMGLISGGDELSKSLLGQGDPTTAVAAHVAESGAMGLLGGALFGKAEQVGLKAIENMKLGTKVNSFLSGLGHAASFPNSEVVPLAESALTNEEHKILDDTAFKLGQTAYKNMGAGVAGAIGGHLKGRYGFLGGAAIEKYLEKLLSPYTSKISQKYIAPAILKAASSERVQGLTSIIDHASTCSKGFNKINRGVESLFESGGNKALEETASEKDREKLRKFIEDGGVDKQVTEENQQAQPQGFAGGGQVKDSPEAANHIEQVYPEQNVLLSATKGRVSNYLNSVRPIKDPNKLPYDSEHKTPQHEKDYNKVLDLANQPLSILNHVKKGSLLPEHMKHFTSMYPDLYSQLSQKMTERIAKGNLKEDKKPPYHIRQSMSLFLGSSLDSTTTPQAIQAAQQVFMAQKSQKQAAMSALNKVGENSMTPEQSREKRLNKN